MDLRKLKKLIELLEEDPTTGSRPGRVDGVTTQWHEPREGVSGFVER